VAAVVTVPLLRTFDDWFCPNCDLTERTPALPPNGSRFHTCPGLHALTAPLVRVGTDCKVEAVERADYLACEVQSRGDDGKPYMAVRTTRRDGTDVAVNAGLAQARLGDAR
jgi:hypothetical protein